MTKFRCKFQFDLEDRENVVMTSDLLINVPKKRVWDLLNTIGHLEKVHPFCEAHTSSRFEQKGDRDYFRFYNQKEFHREIIAFNEGNSFTLNLFDETNYRQIVTFSAMNIDSNKSKMSISFKTNSFKNIPKLEWKASTSHQVKLNHERYFGSVLKGFSHYLTTGKEVKRNQFGMHSEYSPTV